MPTIFDTFTRFSRALELRYSFRADDDVEVFERVGRQVGGPRMIRVDQGTEFLSRDLDPWTCQRGATLDFFWPGTPTNNVCFESLGGKFLAECRLNARWFMSLEDARRKMEVWRRHYNEDHPNSAIGNKPPIALLNRSAAHGPP